MQTAKRDQIKPSKSQLIFGKVKSWILITEILLVILGYFLNGAPRWLFTDMNWFLIRFHEPKAFSINNYSNLMLAAV